MRRLKLREVLVMCLEFQPMSSQYGCVYMQLWPVFATFGNHQTNTGYIFEFILGINAAISWKFLGFILSLQPSLSSMTWRVIVKDKWV